MAETPAIWKSRMWSRMSMMIHRDENAAKQNTSGFKNVSSV